MILDFSKIEHLPVGDARSAIASAPKMRLGEIKIYDLITEDSHGIYLFFSPDSTTCLYVGKNSSMQFVERIPLHFAIGETSWQNHFLKKYRNHYKSGSLPDTAKAVSGCHILLMPVRKYELIAKAEKFFRVVQKPVLNELKSYKYEELGKSASDFKSVGDAINNLI
jgi:hypothetical protein